MKIAFPLFAAVFALALTAAPPALAEEPAPSTPQDIVATAVGTGDLKILIAAVKQAKLAKTLQGEGPFTVFAPTDEAFMKLPAGTIASLLKPEHQDKLTATLNHHIVAEKIPAQDFAKRPEVQTVQGATATIKVEDGKVLINDAHVVKTDILCSNGVIHWIDKVLLPK